MEEWKSNHLHEIIQEKRLNLVYERKTHHPQSKKQEPKKTINTCSENACRHNTKFHRYKENRNETSTHDGISRERVLNKLIVNCLGVKQACSSSQISWIIVSSCGNSHIMEKLRVAA